MNTYSNRNSIVSALTFVLLAAILCHGQQPVGSTKMLAEPLLDVLRRIDPNRTRDLDALAARLLEESRAQARDAIRIWRSPDKTMSYRAEVVLSELGEVALVPLLETAGTNTPIQEVWLLQHVGMVENEMRKKVAARVNKLLDDRRPLPPPAVRGARPEGGGTTRRVCDEAFVLMRRYINPSESAEQHNLAMELFLGSPEKERDATIQKARRSRLWQQWVQGGVE
jgi:hypothetical protein